MDFILTENTLTTGDYNALRTSVGWSPMCTELAKTSLSNSWYIVTAVYEDMVVGMARIIGDGGFMHFIQDIIVRPDYQGNGIGAALMKRCMEKIKSSVPSDASVMVSALADKGQEKFYERYGFRARPNEYEGAGLTRFVVGDD